MQQNAPRLYSTVTANHATIVMESIKHKMQGLIKDKEEAVERAVQLETEKQEKEDRAKEVL